MSDEGIQYYWCVNCGHHGDLGKKYKISKNCQSCGYKEVTKFTEKEIKGDKDLWMSQFKKKSSLD